MILVVSSCLEDVDKEVNVIFKVSTDVNIKDVVVDEKIIDVTYSGTKVVLKKGDYLVTWTEFKMDEEYNEYDFVNKSRMIYITKDMQVYEFSSSGLIRLDATDDEDEEDIDDETPVQGELKESDLRIVYGVNHSNIHCTTFTFKDHSGTNEKNAWNSEDANTAQYENRYFCALPFNYVLYGASWIYNRASINPNIAKKSKNEWIKITNKANKKVVYVQWLDVGPWYVDDMFYVFDPTGKTRPRAEVYKDATNEDKYIFGHFADPKRTAKMSFAINGGGIDISPHAMYYLLNGTGNTSNLTAMSSISVDWEFIEEKNVPTGPWKWNITRTSIKSSLKRGLDGLGVKLFFFDGEYIEDLTHHTTTDYLYLK
jgi:hypothetical protein